MLENNLPQDERINPQTGTPEYFNINKQSSAPKIDWSAFRRQNAAATPVSNPVGLQFEPYGGLKDIDEGFNSLDLQDIPEFRANNQSNLGLVFKALGQATNEAALGTLEGAGYLGDLEGLGNSLAGNEEEFDNWFSKIFRDLKENINEKYLPIYQTHAAQNGELLDRTALAGGLKNVATSLSLMIPALGVARGINVAGKLVGMGGNALAITEAVGAGMASRAAENTMEAQQYLKQYTDQNKSDLAKKYEDKAMEEINRLPMVIPANENGFSPYTQEQRQMDEQRILDRYKAQIDNESKQMAIKGANRVFQADGAMLVVDALQYMPIFKGFNNVLNGVRGGKALAYGLEIGSEAGEEIYQSGVQANAYGSVKAGEEMLGPGFSERMREYFASNEMKQSAFWGALGAGVFTSVGPIAKKSVDIFSEVMFYKDMLARKGKLEEYVDFTDAERESIIYQHAKRNRLGRLAEDLEAVSLTIDEKDWSNFKSTKEEASSVLNQWKEDIDFAKNELTILDADEKFKNHNEAKLDFLKTKLASRNNGRLIQSIDKSITDLYKDIETNNELSRELVGIKKVQDQINALNELKSKLSSIPSLKKNKDLRNKVASETDAKINTYKVRLEQLKDAYLEKNPEADFATLTKTSKDQTIADKHYKLNELNTNQDHVIKPKLAAYESFELIKENNEKIKKERTKAQKKEAVKAAQEATTAEEIDQIAESVEEETLPEVINSVEDNAFEEELTAPSNPNERYLGRPNLFTSEIGNLEGHVLSEYGGVLDPVTDRELSAILLSASPEEFVKNLRMLENLAMTSGSHNRLFHTISKFYKNIEDERQDQLDNETVVDNSQPTVEEFTEPQETIPTEEPESELTVNEFYPSDRNTSDIGFIPMDEKLAQGVAPNRAAVRQYTMTNGFVKRVNGMPELDIVGKTMPIDFDYVNNEGTLMPGSEIYFVVNLDATVGAAKDAYHSKLKGGDFINKAQILIAQKDKDGKEHIVNALPAYSEGNNSEENQKLKDLRNEIWSGVRASGKRSGMHNTGLSSKVTKKYSGRLLVSNGVNSPHEVIGSQKLVFGIATNINGSITINPGKNVGAEYQGIEVSDKNNGGVFMLVKGANGRVIPVRCFTQRLSKFPELLKQAKELLLSTNKDNWAFNREQLRKIVYLDYNYIAATDSFELRGGKGSVKTFKKEEIDSILKDKIIQISSSEINRDGYNEKISKEGRLKTDLNPVKFIGNANFEFSLDYGKIGDSTKVDTSKKLESIPEEYDTDRLSTDPIFGIPTETKEVEKELPNASNNGNASYGTIAADYLMTGGVGVMLSTDYLLQALSGSFTKAGSKIDSIRKKYASELNTKEAADIKNYISTDLYKTMMSEIRNIIKSTYSNKEAEVLFDEILKHPTGLPVKLGNEISIKLDILNSVSINVNTDISATLSSLEDFENPLGIVKFRLHEPTATYEEFYEKWDEQKETQWFKERFDVSLINTEEFRNSMINIANSGGRQAWGMFKNGVAYISGAAKVGTTYHEAFHVVFNLFLNDKQQAQVLDEASKLFKIDRANTLELEEKLAEKFMDYIQMQETRGLGQRILDFFRNLYYAIKSNLTSDLTINQLFDKTQNKGFKTAKFQRNVDGFKVTRYKHKDFTSYEWIRRSVTLADFMRKALDNHIESTMEYKTLPRREVLERMTAKTKNGNTLKGIDLLALSARASVIAKMKSLENITPEYEASVVKMLEHFIGFDESGNVVFNDLGKKALLQFAKTEGLRIRMSTKEIMRSVDMAGDPQLMEFFEEESMNEGWQIKAEQLSGKESLSNEVRKELSYIPKLTKNGNVDVDDLGFEIYQDFNTVYADLQRDLANIINDEEMIERMMEIVVIKPHLKKLLEKITSDNLFKTKMFVNFNKSHVDYKIVNEYFTEEEKDAVDERGGTYKKTVKNKQFNIISSNRNGIKTILVDEWKDNSVTPEANKLLNKDGSFNAEELDRVKKAWSVISSRLKAKSVYDEKDMSDISRIFNYVGLTISKEDMMLINKDIQTLNNYTLTGHDRIAEFKVNADKIMNSFISGKNPFGATSQESEAIDFIAKSISKFRFELMESSFKNAENNTVFAHQVPTFLSRFIGQFKGKNALSKIEWYKETPFYRNSPWLKELMELESRVNFNFIEIDAIKYHRASKGVRYTAMSEKDFENTAINMYFNNGSNNYVYYKFPVVSDAPKMPFVHFRRYDSKEVLDKLYEVYKQEWARISQVKARMAERKRLQELNQPIPDELKAIKNFDTDKSLRFLFLPFLNAGHGRKMVEAGNEAGIKDAIKRWMDQEAANDYNRLVALNVLGKDEKGNINYDNRIDKKWGSDVAFHKDYFYNAFLANTQMMSLFSGDPAFYKADKNSSSIFSRTVDYQKRNKQNVSPKTTMDVNAVFHLSEEQAAIEGKPSLEVGTTYNNIYIKDLEIASNHAEQIFNILASGGMEEHEAAEIAAAYGYANSVDENNRPIVEVDITENGQTKTVKIASSKVNVTDAQAYITLPRYREIMVGLGRWTSDLQDLYPKLMNGTASKEELMTVMQPIKPFYFGHTKIGNMIIPVQNKNSEYLLLPQLVKGSEQLSKIYNYMIQNNIGAANFNSAVKAGEFGAETWDNIEKATVHQMNNMDYGLQQETPEHHIDSRSLFGSQLRKIIISDIDPNTKFNIGGREFSKMELVDLYQSLISQDLAQDYEAVAKRFDNIENIHDLLLAEILERDLGEEREIAIELVERVNRKTGEKENVFNLPLYHPYHAKSNESLMNAAFKNNVTKQKIKGGAFVQLSSFGFTDQLNLIMDGDRMIGAQVMLPWWSKKFFEPLLDNKGQLDINKVPQNLREMIGYRIPTEDKYSMLPLVVKGFLPASAGGAVMLPMEITSISGSDFDIDKMYIMMPEFEKVGNDIVKVKYNYNKDVTAQSKKARNNAKIDIIRAILTHPDTFKKGIKSGGFPTLTDLAKKVLELEGKADEMLPIALPSTQTELFKRNMTGKQLIGIFANHNTSHTVAQYSNLQLSRPVALNGRFLNRLNQIKNYKGDFISRNVAEWLAAVVDNAKNPLSSFINVNTYTADVAALLTRLGYPLDSVVAFLSQPILKEFSNLYFKEGANKMAEMKAISEIEKLFGDSFKDSRSQGSKESSDDYTQRMKDYLSDKTLFEAIQEKSLKTQVQFDVFKNFLAIKQQATTLAELVRATRSDTKGAGPTLSENEKMIQTVESVLRTDEIIGQHELFYGNIVGSLLNGNTNDSFYGDKISNILSTHYPQGAEVTYIKRNDDGTMSEKLNGIIEGYDVGLKFNGFIITGEADTIPARDILVTNGKTIEELINMDHPYKMNTAFYEFGVNKPTELLSKYFPWVSSAFRMVKENIAQSIANKSLTVKQIEQINYELLGYAATGFEFFNGSDRAVIINNMANRVRAFKAKYPKIAEENYFINKLVFKKDERNPSLPEKVQFKNTGSLTEQDRQQVKEAWTELLESPKFSNFANELIKYAFYSSGFQLNANSFSHLIPVEFYSNLVDSNGLSFNDYLENMIDEAQSNVIFLPFVDQFFKNNWDDLNLVPSVDNEKFENITGGLKYVNGKPAWFEVNAKDKNTKHDFVIDKTKIPGSDDHVYQFAPFVSYREKGYTYLYKLDESSFDVALYVLTNKLGIPNSNLEYDRSNPDLQSVIAQNNPFTQTFTLDKILENIEKAGEAPKKIEPLRPTAMKDSQNEMPVKKSNISEYVNHSGGAVGADIVWDEIGKKYGMINNKHYWMTEKTPHGNIEITKADEIEGQQKVTIAARQMGRIEPTHQVRDTKLIRNWSQVKYSDAVFAIATILNAGAEMNYGKKALITQVKGGTGYAVQMAINEGKPVYIFDQVRNQWYSNINGKWAKSEVPVLTKNFAGVGTRELNDRGRRAIEDVYKKSIENIIPKAIVEKRTQLWAEHYKEIMNKYPDMSLNVFSNMTDEQVKKLIECL